MVEFKNLPDDVQNKVREHLRAYDSVNVWYEYGEYSFVDAIKAYYAPDHKYIGTYHKDEIFTVNEQIENYINTFHAYPSNYKGNRDYRLLHKMDDDRECVSIGNGKLADTSWYGKLDENGNFTLTEKRTVIF